MAIWVPPPPGLPGCSPSPSRPPSPATAMPLAADLRRGQAPAAPAGTRPLCLQARDHILIVEGIAWMLP